MKCHIIDIILTLLLVEAVIECRAEDATPPDVQNHQNINLLPKDCGLVQPQKRIVGGKRANLFEFPWIVLLGYEIEGGIQYDCTGTVINNKYILTSAVCGIQKDLKIVRLGEYNITSDKDCLITTTGEKSCAPPVQDISVDKIIVHPNYSESDYKKRLQTSDIALLRLSSDITFNEAVSPVCLPLTPVAFHNLTIVGWGLTDYYDSESRSDVLLKAKVPYRHQTNCKSKIIPSYQDDPLPLETEICAEGSRKDTCTGDSGGPLLTLKTTDNDVKYVQIGITSFPIACAIHLALYSDVTLYMKWILDNLQ